MFVLVTRGNSNMLHIHLKGNCNYRNNIFIFIKIISDVNHTFSL